MAGKGLLSVRPLPAVGRELATRVWGLRAPLGLQKRLVSGFTLTGLLVFWVSITTHWVSARVTIRTFCLSTLLMHFNRCIGQMGVMKNNFQFAFFVFSISK